jgi:hypothetical protein
MVNIMDNRAIISKKNFVNIEAGDFFENGGTIFVKVDDISALCLGGGFFFIRKCSRFFFGYSRLLA